MRDEIQRGRMSESDKAFLFEATQKQIVKSGLSCFNGTKGIRPGEVSILLGPKGNGKSALCKTISYDCMRSKAQCLHILSEETTAVYKASVADVAYKMIPEQADDRLDYLLYDSMLDWPDEHLSFSGFMARLFTLINEFLPEVIIFDNFSTSFFGTMPINKQAEAVNTMRKIANDSGVAIVLVSHTAKGSDIYRQALTGEDIRGNANSTNTGSYNYVLSTFFRCDPPRAFMFIDKARYHSHMNQTYWELMFDKDSGIFVKDTKSSYEEIKNVMNEHNKGVDFKKQIATLVKKEMDKISKGGW